MLSTLVICALSLQGVLVGAIQPPPHTLKTFGSQKVNHWKLNQQQHPRTNDLIQPSDGLSELAAATTKFPEQWFTQPLDHFTKNSPTFRQRYWVNTRHYTPDSGGPVIVIDGGETSGTDRLPFLDTGIAEILAKATGGVGVVLEHRYYGNSVPVENFTTDSLRWLNNAQALQDSANFLAHVNFSGVGIDEDLTAPKTPWIYYGGSYAGARAAHMKVLYPDLVFGAIASSGVTHASVELWEYMDVIRRYANSTCSAHLVNYAETIDKLLKIPPLSKIVKALFGLAGLKHDYDFISTIESTLESWQSKNWDPAINDPTFDQFCATLDASFAGLSNVVDYNLVTKNDVKKLLAFPGVDLSMFTYAKYVRDNVVSGCAKGQTVEQCFGTFNDTQYQGTSLNETWRLWTFQVCTEWGYFFVAPPDKELPRIVSRLHTLENESRICHQAFPPGQHFTVPSLPNVTAVNVLGSFSIAADRLAIIDGEDDPWRPVTPHSSYYAKDRPDTTLQPFELIPGAVHHWDENGLKNMTAEPKEILQIHEETISFVKAWLKGRE